MLLSIARLLILGLLVVAVVGCSSGDSASEGRTEITIAHFWGSSRTVWDSVIHEFERSHPDIQVVQQVQPFNVHTQKVMTMAAANADVGDLVLLEDWFAQELIQRNFLVDLKPYIERDLDSSEYFAQSLSNFSHDGAVRAFPVALGTYPLYYNKDLFDAAGVAYPDSTWTYDTLLRVAETLTRDTDGDGTPDQWGILLDNSGGFDGAIYSLGGAVLTDDLQHSAFDEPRTKRALQFWVDLVRKYHVAPPSTALKGGTSVGGSMRPFETGRFAMAMLQADVASYANVPFDWDVAMPPKGPAGRRVLRYSEAFGIPRTSKHPDSAWEFLRWMVEDMPPRFANRLFYGQVPNSRRLASSDAYLLGKPRVNRAVIVDLIEDYSFSYWRTRWQQFRDQGFLPQLDLMMLGKKSVDEGAADASRRINEVLSQ